MPTCFLVEFSRTDLSHPTGCDFPSVSRNITRTRSRKAMEEGSSSGSSKMERRGSSRWEEKRRKVKLVRQPSQGLLEIWNMIEESKEQREMRLLQQKEKFKETVRETVEVRRSQSMTQFKPFKQSVTSSSKTNFGQNSLKMPSNLAEISQKSEGKTKEEIHSSDVKILGNEAFTSEESEEGTSREEIQVSREVQRISSQLQAMEDEVAAKKEIVKRQQSTLQATQKDEHLTSEDIALYEGLFSPSPVHSEGASNSVPPKLTQLQLRKHTSPPRPQHSVAPAAASLNTANASPSPLNTPEATSPGSLEPGPERHLAAVLIQRVYRGHRVRLRLVRQVSSVLLIQRLRCASPPKGPSRSQSLPAACAAPGNPPMRTQSHAPSLYTHAHEYRVGDTLEEGDEEAEEEEWEAGEEGREGGSGGGEGREELGGGRSGSSGRWEFAVDGPVRLSDSPFVSDRAILDVDCAMLAEPLSCESLLRASQRLMDAVSATKLYLEEAREGREERRKEEEEKGQEGRVFGPTSSTRALRWRYLAALRIQRVFRGYLVRRRLAALREAAVRIQSAYKGGKDRQRFWQTWGKVAMRIHPSISASVTINA